MQSFSRYAAITDGRSLDSRDSTLFEAMPSLAGSPIERVALRSLTTGADGALSMEGDSFRGYVDLAPGENRLEIALDLVGDAHVTREVAVFREAGE